jgi:hypothetical protein
VGLLDVGLRVSVAEPLVGAVAAVVAAAARVVRALARAGLRVADAAIRQAAQKRAILSTGAGARGAEPKPGPIPDTICRLGLYPNPASGRARAECALSALRTRADSLRDRYRLSTGDARLMPA